MHVYDNLFFLSTLPNNLTCSSNNIFTLVNILKILYANCREMYEDMIDHHSNIYNLSSCLFILLVSSSSKSESSESEG